MSGPLAILLFLTSSTVLPAHDGREDEAKSTAPGEEQQKKKEKERKPAPKASPVPAYTNDDLKKTSPGSEGTETTGETPAEPPAVYSGEGSSEGYSEGYSGEASGPTLNEADWRSRAAERRAAIPAAEAALRGLEEQAKELGLRILLSTDTNEILDLRSRQGEMNEQVEQARRNVAEAKQALDDVETEARRAGVPPGWLREP